jgi:hypothetical protein
MWSIPQPTAAPPVMFNYQAPVGQPDAAYTAVPVRQTFAQYIPSPAPQYQQPYGHPLAPPPGLVAPPPPPPSQPREAPRSGGIEWPDSVRQYVQRSFMEINLDPMIPRAEIEAKLKEVISFHRDNGALYTTNWDAMPVPTAIIKQEREMQLRRSMATLSTSSAPPEPSSSAGRMARKRKSGDDLSRDDDDDDHSPTPPWHAATSASATATATNHAYRSLGDRVTSSPSRHTPSDEGKSSKLTKSEKRQRRFDGGYKTRRSPTPPPSAGPVVGTCQTLEKKYLRLTAPPVPSVVRPESVLRQTLELLKMKWKQENNYSYICDQFKSMRQDLTVQRIKNDFTVSVYEIHARIALEKGDLGEYNQCQTQLRSLYAMGLKGNPVEFKAYRILYFIHTANRSGLNDAMADLTPAEKEEPPIKHALQVRSALALGNYHKFFQLYNHAPNMGDYLMDMFVVRERLAALCRICKAYKPDVKLRFVTEELGFDSDHDAAQFICDYQGQDLLEERPGSEIHFLTAKAGPLFDTARAEAFRVVDIKGQI